MLRATPLRHRDYAALAAVRYRIRRFLAFSEGAARESGIEPQQHQLLLAIRGLPPGQVADVTTVAERLQIRHHSAVELVRRAVTAGLVTRTPDPADARRVTLGLTRHGEVSLERLSRMHRGELVVAGEELIRALRTLMRTTVGPAT
jgi:DNA-binding MarR family transcriptional regulator